jgi:hypothetical protein
MENDWDFNGDIYGDSIPLLAEYYCNRPHNFFPVLWRMLVAGYVSGKMMNFTVIYNL